MAWPSSNAPGQNFSPFSQGTIWVGKSNQPLYNAWTKVSSMTISSFNNNLQFFGPTMQRAVMTWSPCLQQPYAYVNWVHLKLQCSACCPQFNKWTTISGLHLGTPHALLNKWHGKAPLWVLDKVMEPGCLSGWQSVCQCSKSFDRKAFMHS